MTRTSNGLEEAPTPALPTVTGPLGIRFDFNDGCRVMVPAAAHGWRVRLTDLDTANVLYDSKLAAGMVISSKRYYLRGRIEVWTDGAPRDDPAPVFTHDYSAADRPVLAQFPAGTLGDLIAWFPAADRFQQRHHCRLTVAIRAHLIPIFAPAYPNITFATAAEIRPDAYYAGYRVMVYFNDLHHNHQPVDYQLIGLPEIASNLLGLEAVEERPRLAPIDERRPIAEPYVCIATQSTAQAKYWNNPDGWRTVIAALQARGYRVVCIDQKPVHGLDLTWNHIPHGVDDQTGDRPLLERMRWLKHSAFFVGLSSGLSWLAWAVGKPVVLISGFTHPLTEFKTPFRVINYHACNSCWNDVRLNFDNRDFFWCPRHQGTPRQFECTRLITPTQVIAALRRIPDCQFPAAPASVPAPESACEHLPVRV